jgi:hypothetical protein
VLLPTGNNVLLKYVGAPMSTAAWDTAEFQSQELGRDGGMLLGGAPLRSIRAAGRRVGQRDFVLWVA